MTWVDDMMWKGSLARAAQPTVEDVRRAELSSYSERKAIAVLLARRQARRLTVTDGRVAASVELYQRALEKAKR